MNHCPDFGEARRFLARFPGNHTLLTFDDYKHRRFPGLVEVAPSERLEELASLNDWGAGVFFAVNLTDGRGRKRENITKIRAVFADDDTPKDEPRADWPIPASFVVESSPGKFHYYWRCDDLTLAEFEQIQKHIAREYGTDPSVCDAPRVMRLPGFSHCKGDPYPVRVVSADDNPRVYSRDEILAAFPETSDASSTSLSTTSGKDDAIEFPPTPEQLDDIKSALSTIPSDDRETWIKVGHALKTIPGDQGRELFIEWSIRSHKWNEERDLETWEDLRPERTGWRAIFSIASEHGWKNPIVDASRVPDFTSLAITAHEWSKANLAPRCIVQDYLYADVAVLVAPGGTGKTTLLLYECIHIVLGWPLYGLKVKSRGTCILITAEDARERLVARMREICSAMMLAPEEVDIVRRSILIWDVSANCPKLAMTSGDIRVTPTVEAIAERAAAVQPVLLIFDPLVSFGAGEEKVNESAQAMVTAARIIQRRAGCCVRYVHHTGQDVARAKGLDQYSGRGGSALADGCRMVAVLQPWSEDASTSGSKSLRPPFTPEPGAALLVLARPKLSYAPAGQPLLWIEREGYHFHHHPHIEPTCEERIQAQDSKVLELVDSLVNEQQFPTKTTLKEGFKDYGLHMTRRELRQTVDRLLVAGRLIHRDAPRDGSHGGKRRYLATCPANSQYRTADQE